MRILQFLGFLMPWPEPCMELPLGSIRCVPALLALEGAAGPGVKFTQAISLGAWAQAGLGVLSSKTLCGKKSGLVAGQRVSGLGG